MLDVILALPATIVTDILKAPVPPVKHPMLARPCHPSATPAHLVVARVSPPIAVMEQVARPDIRIAWDMAPVALAHSSALLQPRNQLPVRLIH